LYVGLALGIIYQKYHTGIIRIIPVWCKTAVSLGIKRLGLIPNRCIYTIPLCSMEPDEPENPEAPSALDTLVAPAEPVLVWYNTQRVELAKARANAISNVERGINKWEHTNVTLLPDNAFKLSCAGCDETISYGNVSRSWSRHSCIAEMMRGQVLNLGTWLLHSQFK
jgi:hypothetical protein